MSPYQGLDESMSNENSSINDSLTIGFTSTLGISNNNSMNAKDFLDLEEKKYRPNSSRITIHCN
jgi:hypothetical protein